MRKYFIVIFILMLSAIFSILRAQSNVAASDDTTRLQHKNIIEGVKSTLLQDDQELMMSEDDIISYMDGLPPFSIYKDNFFITGIPLNKRIDGETADAKFQISIRHRLTSSKLPFNSFLFLTYTQKSFWDIYRESAPFKDSNYNPGIGLGRYIIVDNRLTGAIFLQIEHESNGRDSVESRSLNWIGLSGKYFITSNLAVRLKVIVPYLIGANNSDILDYRGTGFYSVDYKSINNQWRFSGTFNPKMSKKAANLKLIAAYKISERFNQFLFAEFYSGTGDTLLEYKRKDLQLRIGISIKPDFYNVF